ncbi:hypothetical protein KSS87_020524 [Heliosperma pusillum]|nr:hypothetical protein KSS87_020524 [Heliosperma pusillum]
MDVAGTFEGAKYDSLLFDLDDTLYPLSSGINLACRKKIEEFMLEYLHIDETEVPTMCLELYKEYGTTMAGLKVLGYEFDNDEFHEYVHGSLPYENLKPDPLLRNLLVSTPQRKIIFTNSDKAHVVRALKKLGLEDCFEGVICFETLNPSNNPISKSSVLCKPSVEAIEAAMKIANLDPKRTVGRSELVPGADYALGSIHNMKEALPELWEPEAKEQLEQLLAVETAVLA